MYLDNAATTKIHPLVTCAMKDVSYANYNAKYYAEAVDIKKQIDNAQISIANSLKCARESIVFTSGATESNNYIIKGMFELYPHEHFITSSIEHKSVLETFKYIESKGAMVTYLKPNQDGEITLENVKSNLTDNTILVSLMHVNNETGVITDIEAINNYLKQNNIYFHSDCVQSLGKLSCNYATIDFLSFSSHKIHGPKGIGLAVNNTSLNLPSLIHGSDQQDGNRAGTLPNELIVGFAKAIELILETTNDTLLNNKQRVIDLFAENFGDDLVVNFPNNTVDSIISIRLKGEINQIFLEQNKDQIKASTGSSCSIGNPSYVLRECGFSDEMISETLRLSVNKYDILK